jgi:bla regulator protein BlaR1
MTILLESAIRVTLIAAVIAMVLFAMRIKTASVQHAVWAGVVVLMLLLPAWVAWGPKASIPILRSDRAPAVVLLPPPSPVELVSRTPSSPASVPVRSPAREGGGYVAIYLLGVGVLLLRLGIGTLRANRLTSASCVVPVTVGLLHPRIILPKSSRGWPQAQLDAVLAHEGEHIRRRDPLFQWLALLNRALFWFHPLAWWLERKLSGLAEEACDAAVIARGHDPREYSEYLLDLARSVERAGTRIDAVGMAMPGIGLKHRIRRMLSGVPVPRISRPRMACTVAVCAGAAAILAVGTLVHAQSNDRPTFEVASIRPSNPKAGPVPGGGKSKDGGGGLRAGLDHGRFNFSSTLFGLIIRTYGLAGCGEIRADCALVSGGPEWLKKDRFDIQAKMPDGSPDYTFPQFLRGQAPQLELMLQAMLAERFHLKFHRETKQLPVYALTVVKKGSKLKKASGEMIQLKDGTSVKNQSLLWTPAPLPDGTRSDHLIRMFMRDQSMQSLVDSLSRFMDHPVLDRTGLKGTFDITIDYEMDVDAGDRLGADITGPAMFTAFQEQLGLKFESTRAPVDLLVIDHVEKPSEN